ncbi:MAG: LPS assembly lipoprotein LptE [Nitrosomonas sp.]|nr:LPS assembly lipoprotein LptE [Nitrosomonas sp.]MDP1951232.1 LPS assembly lipoprotein LptE [Nitrosomonas sp.]
MKRSFIIVMLLLLTACGFKLRGQISNLPFETLYISAPAGHSVESDLMRAINAGTTTRVVNKLEDAEAILQIVNQTNERTILSLSGGGRVREFVLVYRITTRIVDTKGIEIIPTNELALTRILPFLDEQVLAKEAEATMLYKDMQADAVRQILWRLSAIKSPEKTEAGTGQPPDAHEKAAE